MSDAVRAKADKLSHQQSVHAQRACRARMRAMSRRLESRSASTKLRIPDSNRIVVRVGQGAIVRGNESIVVLTVHPV